MHKLLISTFLAGFALAGLGQAKAAILVGQCATVGGCSGDWSANLTGAQLAHLEEGPGGSLQPLVAVQEGLGSIRLGSTSADFIVGDGAQIQTLSSFTGGYYYLPKTPPYEIDTVGVLDIPAGARLLGLSGDFGNNNIPSAEVDIYLGNPFAAAAPEPATWAMMLTGLAGLGFLAHRRRHAAAPSAI